jgi:hypothetical protein
VSGSSPGCHQHVRHYRAREVAHGQLAGDGTDQLRMGAQLSLDRGRQPAGHVLAVQWPDPVHLHVLVEDPHPVGAQMGERISRALRLTRARAWPELVDQITQLLPGLVPRHRAPKPADRLPRRRLLVATVSDTRGMTRSF